MLQKCSKRETILCIIIRQVSYELISVNITCSPRSKVKNKEEIQMTANITSTVRNSTIFIKPIFKRMWFSSYCMDSGGRPERSEI